MLLFICRKWIVCYVLLLKTRVHLGLAYLKVDILESFVFSYSFLVGFHSVLILRERSPKVIRVRTWVDWVSELHGMRSSRTAGTGERIEPAANQQELWPGEPELLLARKSLHYQISWNFVTCGPTDVISLVCGNVMRIMERKLSIALKFCCFVQ
jgi:hypothetical protein